MRRGGATFVLLQGKFLEVILLRGRWKSFGVGRLYLEDGLAHLPSLRTPPVGLGRINEYAVSGTVEGSQIKAVLSALATWKKRQASFKQAVPSIRASWIGRVFDAPCLLTLSRVHGK